MIPDVSAKAGSVIYLSVCPEAKVPIVDQVGNWISGFLNGTRRNARNG